MVVDGFSRDEGQWEGTSNGRRPAEAGSSHRKRGPSPQKRALNTKGMTDSTPMMVADFVFRKQIDWLVENTGVRNDFKDVALKIWFRYGV